MRPIASTKPNSKAHSIPLLPVKLGKVFPVLLAHRTHLRPTISCSVQSDSNPTSSTPTTTNTTDDNDGTITTKQQPLTATPAITSTTTNNRGSQASSSSITIAAPQRSVSSRTCRQCNGTRVVNTRAGRVPCPSCAPWRQRLDYQPNRTLLSMRDMNLSSLDNINSGVRGSSSRNGGYSSGSGSSFDEEKKSKLTGKESETDEDVSKKTTKRKKKPAAPMTEERRQAISKGLQNRGPLQTDHKRNISRAMRAMYAANPNLRQAGKPKRCSHCGQEGHNRKGCPELYPDRQNLKYSSGSDSDSDLQDMIKTLKSGSNGSANGAAGSTYVCSLCGQPGHNKRSCPLAPIASKSKGEALQGDNKTKKPSKFIVIEEIESDQLDTSAQKDSGSFFVSGDSSPQTSESTTGQQQQNPQSGTLQSSAAASPSSARGVQRSTPIQGPSSPWSPDLAAVRASSLLGSSISFTPDGGLLFPLPPRWEQCVQQAAAAVLRAYDDGIRRQTIELLLPNSMADGGWPGGIRQQFRAALPLVEALLMKLKQGEGLQGRITGELLDEGDCVGAWQSERLAAVLFPTADTLPDLQRIDDALSGQRLTLVINPQWQPQGQVVSDFGFGRTRRTAERFVASFEDTYYLRRVRVLGDELRILRCYPGQWQVHYVRGGPGQTEVLACEDEKPTYERLLALLQGVEGSWAGRSWLDRALRKASFDEFASYDGSSGSFSDGSGNSSDDDDSGLERDIVTGEILNKEKKNV